MRACCCWRGWRSAFEQRIALGPSLGQCCGGALTLHFTPLLQDRTRRLASEPPRFFLQLYGAGHVGRAIVKLLADLPCRVHVGGRTRG